MNRPRLWFMMIAAVWIVLCTKAEAQRTSTMVEINLLGSNCEKAPSQIQVVFEGSDRSSFPAYQDKDRKCFYKGEMFAGMGNYTIGKEVFSIRLAGARSDCRVTIRNPDAPVPVGVLTFPYKPNTAFKVKFTNVEPKTFNVDYLRRLRPDQTVLAGSVECNETGRFEGSEDINDVMFPREQLYLTFELEPKKQVCIEIDEKVQNAMGTSKGASLSPKNVDLMYQSQKYLDQLRGRCGRANRELRANETDLVRKQLPKRFRSATLRTVKP